MNVEANPFCRHAWPLLGVIELLLTSGANAGVVFIECADCSATQMQQLASDAGDGSRYVFDLATGTVRQYEVTGSSGDRTGPATATEVPSVASAGRSVVASLHKAWMAESSFARTTHQITLPISEIGADPSTGAPYVPRDVAWANGNFGTFMQLASAHISSDEFIRAYPVFDAFITALKEAAKVPGAGLREKTIIFQREVEPFQMRLTSSDGSYVLFDVDASGQVAYAGAFDPHGGQYPDHVVPQPSPAAGKG